MNCIKCQKSTNNPKFCCINCASVWTNQNYQKKKKRIWKCRNCYKVISKRRKYCKKCHPFYIDWSKVTLKEARDKRKIQKSSRIRNLARALYKKSDKPKHCIVCGYSLHYEVCHIKAIKEHDENCTVGEVNSLHNLIALCPKHHWEFDNGRIDIEKLIGLSGCAPEPIL